MLTWIILTVLISLITLSALKYWLYCTTAGDFIAKSKNADYEDAITNVDKGGCTLIESYK